MIATDTPAPPSALTALITSHHTPPTHPTHLHTLALQTLHNLQHQHSWTTLRIHTHSPLTHAPLPRPLIAGLPPKRIYVHPDQQGEEVQAGVREEEVRVEREWVLPTHLAEKWSLRRFAEVFDGIGEEPPGDGDEGGGGKGKRRGGKRVLLATVGDDSTVVYYVVHDGIVKPRQN
ncbi:Sen15 protein-domain-containing protein [Usnea florida]